MKKVSSLLFLLLTCCIAFSQSQVYIGLKGGIAGCFYQFNTSTVGNPYIVNYNGPSTTKLTSTGPSIPALFELIYDTKNFRIGYQFEYERILTTSYSYKVFSQYSGAYTDTIIANPDITQHFFCHNLLIEYVAYKSKGFKLVPDLTFGYFHGVSAATAAPYDFSSLNQNRFKIGLALNLEYHLGQVAVVATPNYGLVPIKALFDPTQKGYMHFVGLNIGLRFGLLKNQEDDGKDGAKKPAKKKKEYKNPEEDE